MRWSLATADGISFMFDGTPFIAVGTILYQCHQGNDIDRNTKVKRQLALDEKEVMCICRQQIGYGSMYLTGILN